MILHPNLIFDGLLKNITCLFLIEKKIMLLSSCALKIFLSTNRYNLIDLHENNFDRP